MEARRRQSGSEDYRAAIGVMREVLVTVVNETYEEQLTAISRAGLAVVLLWGGDDHDVPVRTAERALAILGGPSTSPSRRLEVIDGVGHLLPLERPAPLRTAIEELLT